MRSQISLQILLSQTLACLPTVPYDNTFLPGNTVASTVLSFPQPTATRQGTQSLELPTSAGQGAGGAEVGRPIGGTETGTERRAGSSGNVVIETEEGTKTGLQTTKTIDDPPCPVSWTKFASTYGYRKCYKKIEGDFDYIGAKLDCRDRGGAIVTIETMEEYLFLKKLCFTGKTVFLEEIPYIGLVRNDVDGELKWEEGENDGFVRFYQERQPTFEEGTCFKFVTDQTISERHLLHAGQVGFYTAVDCLRESKSALCEIIP